MFIDVTRYGGPRILRLAVAAIAYIDVAEGGSAVRLIGGETLRINEEPALVEVRIDATLALTSMAIATGQLNEMQAEVAGELQPRTRRGRR